jgi:hypothetical protein
MELTRGLATMAVDASHVALLDLRSYPCPSLIHKHSADIAELLLRISVIEFEHDPICDAAINARVRRKVVQHLAPILDTASIRLGDRTPDVIRRSRPARC